MGQERLQSLVPPYSAAISPKGTVAFKIKRAEIFHSIVESSILELWKQKKMKQYSDRKAVGEKTL